MVKEWLAECPVPCFLRLLISLFLVSFSFQGLTLKAYFVPFYNNR